MGAEASFAFVGNTDHNVPFMLKNSDLFEALPSQFHDSAFIDRLHAYLPGWEVDVIRGEMFTSGYGFIVDYLAEILRHLRNDDFSHHHEAFFTLGSQISTRDRDAIHKTMSGLLKLLFPSGKHTEAEVEELLKLAIESRKRVKDQLARIDSTYPDVDFHYMGSDGQKRPVTTVEEEEFPQFYHLKPVLESEGSESEEPSEDHSVSRDTATTPDVDKSEPAPDDDKDTQAQPSAGHSVFAENRKGLSYEKLFGPYLKGATKIVITDPYIRIFYQIRNLMEFIETVAKDKAPEDEVSVHLITVPDEFNAEKQHENLESVERASLSAGIKFTWEFDGTGTIHARHIVTDHGWKISLDRGLDIFQRYEMNDAFSLSNRLQEFRGAKAFEITYMRTE